MATDTPFWETKSLEQMTTEEWESLCDGCGRCCLHKLRDEDDGSLYYTNVACRLLDTHTCRCTDYAGRHRKVQDCITLTAPMLETIDWLPSTCAYKRLSDGLPLPDWHPLLTGNPDSVREAGISAGDRCISERRAGNLEDYVVEWPALDPKDEPAE
ncbi:YcgN family cysteine cluster protein [Acetobacter sp.]|jgi:uncharacterized cysteine cluster protein YcgN (CxxCxxCC family)|uniref:YcgN family cysteine cluster protein n=1 Tax=Acetobacter sp. TaxID=440 RepID=UPI0025B9CDEE|nr:YcgN family cysteine cluster protein [Acetobacter sp.]MCH4092162.1 YcgN family cysteine cluster protein [Acetobacter sp.]MCI1299921.1 YcgN family cysteine cluster protein [Acetobacter sp.]MCI1315939.1 YcgN family cysteine cluster protein [Acetobacter sp.]